MKKHGWKSYALWILLSEAVGGLSALLTRRGMELYSARIVKPPLSPPPAVFPVVWTLLYALMGIGAARVWLTEPSKPRTEGLRLFGAQLAFNFFWSILFFNREAFGAAFFWLLALLVLILWMTVKFYEAEPLAGKLQLPYILWMLFAGYLNLGVWLLNR